MKHLLFGACLVVVLTLCASAQRGTGKGPSRNIPTGPQRPGTPLNNTGGVFLSGKVILDDGTPLTEPAAIQTICRGQKHTEAYTDSHGNFSFEVGRSANANSAGLADADTSWGNQSASRSRTLQDCDLQAYLAGFTSESMPLSSKLSLGESSDVGRLVLHRVGKVEGLTISATTAAAPGPARKAYEKGCKEEAKNHWDEAEQALAKAVEIYPKYAIAWFELGRVQQQKNNPDGARNSFQQSIAADPQYASPYRQLAQLAAMAKQWTEVVNITSKLLALNPVNFPDAWFLNALGNYHQQNLENAEKSARQGIRVDDEHHAPKLELLLGVVLAQRQKYNEAADHLRQYLQLEPNGADSENARKQLDTVIQLASTNRPSDQK